MDFIDALSYLYQNRKNDEEFANPFLLYCRLSDLCSSSYEDKHKVVVFYQIDKKLNIVQSILSRDFDVGGKYNEVADLLSESSFQALIDVVKRAVGFKNEFLSQQAVRAVITPATETEQEEIKTPLVSYNSSSSYYGGMDDGYIGYGIFGLVLFALIGVLALIFDWKWLAWQWILGIGGGIALLLSLSALVYWLNDEVIVDFYVIGTVILGISILINFILLLIFKSNYKIIFACFSVIELIGGLILVVLTFGECEEGWGIFQIIETILALLFMVLGLILL